MKKRGIASSLGNNYKLLNGVGYATTKRVVIQRTKPNLTSGMYAPFKRAVFVQRFFLKLLWRVGSLYC